MWWQRLKHHALAPFFSTRSKNGMLFFYVCSYYLIQYLRDNLLRLLYPFFDSICVRLHWAPVYFHLVLNFVYFFLCITVKVRSSFNFQKKLLSLAIFFSRPLSFSTFSFYFISLFSMSKCVVYYQHLTVR